jgi:NADH:ubiquinone oxidoreductase subunit 4 (subunit M)
MAVCHGFTSPGIFAGANMMYERSHSRSSILNKGLLREFPRIRLMWFLLVVLNFGGPFTINLLSEILIINIIARVSHILLLLAGACCFFSLAYNLLLYATLHQGVINYKNFNNGFFSREILLMVYTLSPAFILLFSGQI